MIGMLNGSVLLKTTTYIIVDVNGVGYKVLVSSALLSKLTQDQVLKLFIYTHVREDLIELFGFEYSEDLRLFEYLISVSGVGCKTALGIFSVGSRSVIINAVVTGDVAFFTSVPRLGKKNAQKIIIELKNKLGGVEDLDLASDTTEEYTQALSALEGFGYSIREAELALASLKDKEAPLEQKVKQALKYLGTK